MTNSSSATAGYNTQVASFLIADRLKRAALELEAISHVLNTPQFDRPADFFTGDTYPFAVDLDEQIAAIHAAVAKLRP